MLNKMRKVLKSEKGFTLIELITVIVILGIILGIGLPKYAKMQAQSEWDSDVTTLRNLEKAAEVLYASQPTTGTSIKLQDISGAGLFDADVFLKRVSSDSNKQTVTATSKRNSTPTKLDPATTVIDIYEETGNVAFVDSNGDGVNDWINKQIGVRPK